MPALLIGAIGMAVGAATGITSAIIKAVPGPADKERKRRLAELEKSTLRAFEKGELGFTQAQQEELSSIGMGAIQGAEREYYSRQNELAALQGITGGALVQQDLARQEAAERQRAAVSTEIRQAELTKREQTKAELKQDLERQRAIVAADQARRKGAAAAAVGEIGETAMDFGTFAYMMEKKYGDRSAKGLDVEGPDDWGEPGEDDDYQGFTWRDPDAHMRRIEEMQGRTGGE